MVGSGRNRFSFECTLGVAGRSARPGSRLTCVWRVGRFPVCCSDPSTMSLDVGVLAFKKERKIREFGVYNDRMGDAPKIDYKNVEVSEPLHQSVPALLLLPSPSSSPAHPTFCTSHSARLL